MRGAHQHHPGEVESSADLGGLSELLGSAQLLAAPAERVVAALVLEERKFLSRKSHEVALEEALGAISETHDLDRPLAVLRAIGETQQSVNYIIPAWGLPPAQVHSNSAH